MEWPTFFKLAQTKKLLQLGILITNYPLIGIPSQNRFFNSGKLSPPIAHPPPPSDGMAYFFQTCPNQKTVADRYTNYPIISIPSQNCFLIRAS